MSNQLYMNQLLEREKERDAERAGQNPNALQVLLAKQEVMSGITSPATRMSSAGDWTPIIGYRGALNTASLGGDIPKLSFGRPTFGYMPWLASDEIGSSPPERTLVGFYVESDIAHLVRPKMTGVLTDGSFTVAANFQIDLANASGEKLEADSFAKYEQANLIYVSNPGTRVDRRPLAAELTTYIVNAPHVPAVLHLTEGLVRACTMGQLSTRNNQLLCSNTSAALSNSHMTDTTRMQCSRILRTHGVLNLLHRTGMRQRNSQRQPAQATVVDVTALPAVATAVKAIQQMYPEINSVWERAGVWFERGTSVGYYSETTFLDAITELLNTADVMDVMSAMLQASVAYNRVTSMATESHYEPCEKTLYYVPIREHGHHKLSATSKLFTKRDAMELMAAAILTSEVTTTRLTNLASVQTAGAAYRSHAHLAAAREAMMPIITSMGRDVFPGLPLDIGLVMTGVRNYTAAQDEGISKCMFYLLPVTQSVAPVSGLERDLMPTADIFQSTDVKFAAIRALLEKSHNDVGAATSQASSDRGEFDIDQTTGKIVGLKEALVPRAVVGALVQGIMWADSLALYDAGCVAEATLTDETISGQMTSLVSMSTVLKSLKYEILWAKGYRLGVNGSRQDYGFYTRDKQVVKRAIYVSSDKVTLTGARREAHTVISTMLEQARKSKVATKLRITRQLMALTGASGTRCDLASAAKVAVEGNTVMTGGMLIDPSESGGLHDPPVVIKSMARVCAARLPGGLVTAAKKRPRSAWNPTFPHERSDGTVYWPRTHVVLGRTLAAAVNRSRSLGYAVRATVYSTMVNLLLGLGLADNALSRAAGMQPRVMAVAAALTDMSPTEAANDGKITQWYGAVGFLATALKIAVSRFTKCNYGSVLPQAWGYIVHAAPAFSGLVPKCDVWFAQLALCVALEIVDPQVQCTVTTAQHEAFSLISAHNDHEHGCDADMNAVMKKLDDIQLVPAAMPSASCEHAIRCDYAGTLFASHECLRCKRSIQCKWCVVAASFGSLTPDWRPDSHYEGLDWVAEVDKEFPLDDAAMLTTEQQHLWESDVKLLAGHEAESRDTSLSTLRRIGDDHLALADKLSHGLLRAIDLTQNEDLSSTVETSPLLAVDEPVLTNTTAHVNVPDVISVEPPRPVEQDPPTSAPAADLQIPPPQVICTMPVQPVPAPAAPAPVPVPAAAPVQLSLVRAVSEVRPPPIPEPAPLQPRTNEEVILEVVKRKCCMYCHTVNALADPIEKNAFVHLDLVRFAHGGSIAAWAREQKGKNIDWRADGKAYAHLEQIQGTTTGRWSPFAFLLNGMINLQRHGWIDTSSMAAQRYRRAPACMLWDFVSEPVSSDINDGDVVNVTAGDNTIDGYADYRHISRCNVKETHMQAWHKVYSQQKSNPSQTLQIWYSERGEKRCTMHVHDARSDADKIKTPLELRARSLSYLLYGMDNHAKDLNQWFLYSGVEISSRCHVMAKWTSSTVMSVDVVYVCDVARPPMQNTVAALWQKCKCDD